MYISDMNKIVTSLWVYQVQSFRVCLHDPVKPGQDTCQDPACNVNFNKCFYDLTPFLPSQGPATVRLAKMRS